MEALNFCVCMHMKRLEHLTNQLTVKFIDDDDDWEDMEEEQVDIGIDNGHTATMVRSFVHVIVGCYFITTAR